MTGLAIGLLSLHLLYIHRWSVAQVHADWPRMLSRFCYFSDMKFKF